jgi:hypothetical protein
MKPDTKEFKEQKLEETQEKLQLDDKHNAEHKSGSKPEVRDVINMLVQSYFSVCINMYNYTVIKKNFISG